MLMPFPADASRNYALPADNPMSIAGIEGSAMGTGIYAAGLRNPWRVSFDRTTGEMYIGDVGEGTFEEINLGRSGANYGWSVTEGPFNPPSFPGYTTRSMLMAMTGAVGDGRLRLPRTGRGLPGNLLLLGFRQR
jgi:hypothetical protein